MERSKLLAAVAVLAMVLCAFAVLVPATETDAADNPTTFTYGVDDSTKNVGGTGVDIAYDNGNQYYVIANGTPIFIDEVDGKTVVTVEDGTVVAEDATGYIIVGGSIRANVASSSITMDSGSVHKLIGGGYYDAATTKSEIVVNGGTVVRVAGGGYAGSGTAGTYSPADNKSIDGLKAWNNTGTADIKITGGKIAVVVGGGDFSYTYVGTTTVTATGGTIGELISGGINGVTENATVVVNGAIIANGGYAYDGSNGYGLITAGNRGEVTKSTITIESLGADSKALITPGALSDATGTDGGTNAVIRDVTLNVTSDVDAVFLMGITKNIHTNPWDSGSTSPTMEAKITINAPTETIIAQDLNSGASENYSKVYDLTGGLTLSEGTKLFVPEGMTVNSKISGPDGAVVTLSNFTAGGENGATITAGSIMISGTISANSAASITAAGEVIIDGVAVSGSDTLTINIVDDGTTTVKIENLTVNSGTLAVEGEVEITGKITVAENSGLNLTNATLANTSTGSIENNGTLYGSEKVPESVTTENNGTSIGVDGTAYVGSMDALVAAIADTNITDIVIDGEIPITSVVTVSRAVTITGAEGSKLIAVPNDGPYNGEWSSGPAKYVMSIEANATVKNLTVDSANSAFGINVYGGTVTLDGVVSDNSAGTGFVLGGSTNVTATNISASNYVWGGMNADGATITLDQNSMENLGSVYTEDAGSADTSNTTINLPAGYKAPVEMTGSWTDGSNTTNFVGYFTSPDVIPDYYNDDRFSKAAVSEITVNEDATLGVDLTLGANTTLTVVEGVTLSIADGATLTYGGAISGKIDFTDNLVATPTASRFPTMDEDALFTYGAYQYIVKKYRYTYDGTDYVFQYGLATNNVTYDGSEIMDNEVSILSIGLPDGDYKVSFANNDNQWYTPGIGVYEGPLEDENAPNAGLYVGAIRFTANITVTLESSSTPIVDAYTITEYLDLIVLQGVSEIDGSAPENSGLTVSQAGNTITVTGEINYDNGYTLVIAVDTDKQYYIVDGEGRYVLANVVLDASMFSSAVSYDPVTGLLTIDLGEDVPDSYGFTVDFDTVDGLDNWTTSNYTLDLTGLTLSRDAAIQIWDDGEDVTVNVGSSGETVTQVTVPSTGDMYFADGDYMLSVTTTLYTGERTDYQYDTVFAGGLKYIAGTDRYYLPIKVTGLLEGATVTVGGNPIKVVDGVATTVYRITEASQAIWIVIDQDGEGEAYQPVTYRADFTNIVLESAVNIAAGTQETYYDKAFADLGSELASVQDGKTVTFTGSLNYITGYEAYGGKVGWFLPWDVTSVINTGSGLKDIVTAIGTIKDKTASDIAYNVTRLNVTEGTFIVDLDGEGTKYIPATYTMVYNVDCKAVGGYDADAHGAWEKIQALGFTGVPENDVAQETMFIVFNPMGQTSGTYTLEFNGTPLTITEGEDGWGISNEDAYAVIVYFTFDEENDHWNGIDIEAGAYTITVYDIDGNELGSVVVPVGGLLGCGFDEDADTVTSEMAALGAEVSDVIANTMYIVWNNDAALTGTITGYLFYGTVDTANLDLSKALYKETATPKGNSYWNEDGIHSWYFSFDDQLAKHTPKVDFAYGTWTMVIYNDTSDEVVVTGVVEIIDYDTFHITLNEEGTRYDLMFDLRTGDMFVLPGTNYADKTLVYWELYVDGAETAVTTFNENGLIIMGQLKDAEGNPVEGQSYEFRAVYGSGDVAEDVVPTDLVVVYQSEYDVGDDFVCMVYVVYSDGTVKELVAGDYSVTPSVMELSTTQVIVSYTEGNVTLNETVSVTVAEPVTVPVDFEEIIDGALGYVYIEYPYTYAGSIAAAGTDVVALYDLSDNVRNEVRDDFARYIGAIGWNSSDVIDSIVFNGTTYVWRADLGLQGSNWVQVDGDGEIMYLEDVNGDLRPLSLVRAVVEYIEAENGTLLSDITLDLRLVAGDESADMTYNLTMIPAEPEEEYFFGYSSNAYGNVEVEFSELAPVARGTEITGTVTVDNGYKLVSVTVDGVVVPVEGNKFTYTVNADSIFYVEVAEIVEPVLEPSIVVDASGYIADQQAAIDTITGLWTKTDISDDISPETMYLMYTTQNMGGQLYGHLYSPAGQKIYSENLPYVDGPHIWYFSFAEGIASWIGSNIETGLYTMEIADYDGNVVLTATVYVNPASAEPEPVPEPEYSEDIHVSFNRDGTVVYLQALDGGYIPEGTIVVEYTYTYYSPLFGGRWITSSATLEITVGESTGTMVSMPVNLTGVDHYSEITYINATFGAFESATIVYTPVTE